MLSIDEIYDLFIWDASYSPEEYEERERKGIAEAGKLKNLFPFLQPVILPPEKSKSVWEPCAKVIAMRPDDQLQPYLFLLFEWLKDMNWPGAEVIFNRLAKMPVEIMKEPLSISKRMARENNDQVWLHALDDFEKIVSSPR